MAALVQIQIEGKEELTWSLEDGASTLSLFPHALYNEFGPPWRGVWLRSIFPTPCHGGGHQSMQGYPIGNSRIRLSQGSSQNNSGPAGTLIDPRP
jgi:hypothetical protein